MNGFGMGITVGLGTAIGLAITSRDAQVIEFVTTFAFYGLMSGFLFHLYQWALKGWQPPFLRR